MELAMRKDVPVELTWDLSLIYETEAAMEADLEKAKALAEEIVRTYQGRLTTPEKIIACLTAAEEMEKLLYLVGSYADLAVSVDYYDTYNKERSNRIQAASSKMFADISFIDNEILEAPDAVLDAAVEQAEGCKNRLKDLRRKKPYQLCTQSEKLLAAMSQTLSTPYDIYNMAKLADMKFPSFEADGKTYPLGFSLFEDDYEYEADTQVRRKAFEVFSDKLRQYENVTATAYNAAVMTEKILSEQRGYASVFDYLLFDQKVSREMYDRQIDLITGRLAPHMRRYAQLLKKVYGLDKMTFADLKLSVDPEYDPKVTIEEAHTYIRNALSVMGEDYAAMVDEAFANRWIDFAKNQGKSTGGFCASPYGKGSFILLSWNSRMGDVFILAHELGHAEHFRLANANQSLYDTNVSTYFVEAPSTIHELLLGQYLLRTSDDPRFKRWVLSNLIGHTYYHNFVTHLREAWYQREVYKIIDAGGSVNAEVLSDIFRRNLELFWGEDVEILPGAELTWMRQPHYYMGLYPYTYSAGLTVATKMADRIQKEGAPAVADWIRVLTAGSTLDPAGLAALGGIDITTDVPLIETIETIGKMIDEICELTEQIEGV